MDRLRSGKLLGGVLALIMIVSLAAGCKPVEGSTATPIPKNTPTQTTEGGDITPSPAALPSKIPASTTPEEIHVIDAAATEAAQAGGVVFTSTVKSKTPEPGSPTATTVAVEKGIEDIVSQLGPEYSIAKTFELQNGKKGVIVQTAKNGELCGIPQNINKDTITIFTTKELNTWWQQSGFQTEGKFTCEDVESKGQQDNVKSIIGFFHSILDMERKNISFYPSPKDLQAAKTEDQRKALYAEQAKKYQTAVETYIDEHKNGDYPEQMNISIILTNYDSAENNLYPAKWKSFGSQSNQKYIIEKSVKDGVVFINVGDGTGVTQPKPENQVIYSRQWMAYPETRKMLQDIYNFTPQTTAEDVLKVENLLRWKSATRRIAASLNLSKIIPEKYSVFGNGFYNNPYLSFLGKYLDGYAGEESIIYEGTDDGEYSKIPDNVLLFLTGYSNEQPKKDDIEKYDANLKKYADSLSWSLQSVTP